MRSSAALAGGRLVDVRRAQLAPASDRPAPEQNAKRGRPKLVIIPLEERPHYIRVVAELDRRRAAGLADHEP